MSTTANNPTRLLMLDSGAFSVWTKGDRPCESCNGSGSNRKADCKPCDGTGIKIGARIDLDDYIAFCQRFPDCSYYVNLDVIPGVPGNKASLTKDAVQASCQKGWDNYRRMIRELPKSKVIPVFHQGDDIKWLSKYLEFGVPYIGISPANDRHTSGTNSNAVFAGRNQSGVTKVQWIRSLRNHLFSADGRPVVKTHGFAVTSYDLIKEMEWHSVDSASWKLAGAWGSIYVPTGRKGKWNFDTEPEHFRASANFDGGKFRKGYAVETTFKHRVMDWLEEINVPVGSYKVEQVDADYKLDRDAKEIWFHKESRVVLHPEEHGVVTSVEERLKVNAAFMMRANKALAEYVKHIYFAGALMPYELEYQLGKRLLSYFHTSGESGAKCLTKHCESIRHHKKESKR